MQAVPCYIIAKSQQKPTVFNKFLSNTLLGTAISMIILGAINIGMTLPSLSSERQQIMQGPVVMAFGQFRLGAVDITVFRKQRKA